MSSILRMSCLPKPEYKLMKDFIERYDLSEHSLEGPAELFTILLRLAYEVSRDHENWIEDVVKTWRAYPDEVRTYELAAK